MEQSQEPFKPINIREVFAEKNPGLAKKMPGFVYRFINRIMHIDEINQILSVHGNERGIEFSDSMVSYFNVRQNIVGLENIPQGGRYIFASNHPLGGFDSMLLMSNVHKRLGEVRFLVNDVLMNIPQLRPIFVPINKHGGLSRDLLQTLHDAYSSDVQILIFPSGFASRKIKGEIRDFTWQKHFVVKAIEYQRDVVPVHISGRNSNFFYNLANFRTRFRIKWNLEMFFLPDELFKQKNQEFTLTFGKPIPWQTFDKSKTPNEWASYVKDIVYSLSVK